MEIKLDFDDVLVVPKWSYLSSRKQVKLTTTYQFKYGNKWTGVPIIATNMSSVGTLGMAKALEKHKMMTWLHKFYTPEQILDAELNPKFFSPSFGLNNDDIQSHVDSYDPSFIHLDVANGYMEKFAATVASTREHYPDKNIIAGTVCTPEGVVDLLDAGADVVRVGIGTGGNCITRVKAGIGYPQFSALLECSKAAKEHRGHIVSDGGCKSAGDVVKAFVAGADFVSIGTMFGAHTENTDEIVDKFENSWIDEAQGKPYALVFGMSSETAMKKYYGKVDKHRTSEGKTSLLPFKGPIANTLQDVLGGVRSACTYTNSKSIKDLRGQEWIRVNNTHNKFYDNHKIGE